MIELVMVIVIVGILANVLTKLISVPMTAYIAQQRRGELVDNANIAIDRITRETHLALPNSVRVTADNLSVEFLRTIDGGRYRTVQGNVGGDVLKFDSADTAFDVIGQLETCNDPKMNNAVAVDTDCANGNAYCLVIDNSGAAGHNAYNAAAGNSNIATINKCDDNPDPTDIILSPDGGDWSDRIHFLYTTLNNNVFPTSGQHRFQIVDTPVTYRCDPGAKTLQRYDGYPIAAAQPNPPTSTPALVLSNVTECSFAYIANSLLFRIKTENQGEVVTMFQEIKVNNDT